MCMMLMVAAAAQAKEWRGIVPLHSTRAEVNRLIGKPNSLYDRYEFENERASIMYSHDLCADGWNVPRDTVVRISVVPKEELGISDLPIDLSKYEKFNDPEVPAHSYYVNREEGIRYDVVAEGKDKGLILNIYYEPAAKDEYLRCSHDSGGRADSVQQCRGVGRIEVDCPTSVSESDTLIKFTAQIYGADPNLQPTYNWTISAGTISSGQRTHTITVETAGLTAQTISAKVELVGFPRKCPKIASCKVSIGSATRKAELGRGRRCLPSR